MSLNIEYKVEIAFTSSTAGYFVIGVSRLGIDTILGGGFGAGADFLPIRGPFTFNTQRGRNEQLDRAEAGTLDLTIDDPDGHLVRENTRSPYYGYMRLLLPIRVSARIGSTTCYLFRGTITEWTSDTEAGMCTMRAVDGFHWLAKWELNAFSVLSTTASERIKAVLHQVKWDNAMMNIESGEDTLDSATLSKTKALEEIANVEKSDFGFFFMDGQGRATYQTRRHRSTDQATSAAFYYGRDYLKYQPHDSATLIYNKWLDGATTLAYDQDSINQNGERPHDLPGPYVPTAQKTSMAKYLLSQYKDGHQWGTLTTRPTNDAEAARYLGLELSDRVYVEHPPSFTRSQFWIEKIAHRVDEIGGWDHTIELELSRCDTGRGMWILGYSRLGIDTILGY